MFAYLRLNECRMKVLFLTSWYPTLQQPYFGVFIKEHAHAIHFAGHNVLVLALLVSKKRCLFQVSIEKNTDESGVRTVVVQVNSVFRDYLYHFLPFQHVLLRRIYRKHILPDFKADIIHSNVVFPAGILGDRLATSLNIPHVITEHWSRIKGALDMPFISGAIVKAYHKSAAIMPVSLFLKNTIQLLIEDLPDNRFSVVGNVVKTNTFYYNEKIMSTSEIRFCAIATWIHKKKPDKLPELFIEALANVQKKVNVKMKLIMIGGGDRLSELSEFSRLNGLDSEFRGFVGKDEICSILHSCDYLVHASTIETFGVGIAEALMTGTPVICSAVGALPELVNASNGVLCVNDVKSWEDGIVKAMTTKYNHNMIAADVNARFGLNAIGEQISQVYNNLKF